MKFEHFALNVPDPRALAAWYVRHASWQIARAQLEPPYKHFLADDSGRVTLEVYHNPAAAIPDFAAAHPLCFHVALYSTDARADCARFLAAGDANDSFFSEGRPGHAHFDLEGYCLHRLAAAGVRRAEGLGTDTRADAIGVGIVGVGRVPAGPQRAGGHDGAAGAAAARGAARRLAPGV